MIQNKIFVIINVLGLGVALACVIVAYLFFKYDQDFDKFHTNRDIIYKITSTKEVNGNRRSYGLTPASLGPAIKNAITGIDNVIRYDAHQIPIRFEENIFNERVAFVDADFFEVFDFQMTNGDKNSIKDKNNVIISERVAEILFNKEDPIGKVITFYPTDNDEHYFLKISGVFKDIPGNSSLGFEALTSIENTFLFNKIEEHSWKDWVTATFIKVSQTDRISIINDQFKDFISIQNDAREDWLIERFYTERFKDIPWNQDTYSYRLNRGQSIEGNLFVGILAVIILLLACLNFMNTFLAISNRRLKEIGVNKVLGGLRRQSILQFLGESILLCFIALFFALTIAPFLLDSWNSMLSMSLNIEFGQNLTFWIFLILLLLFTGITAGAYPAFYISSFNPVKILKGNADYKAGGWFSKTLLAIQFLLAIIGNVAAVMFIQNAKYQDDFYLGYNKDQVIVVPVNKVEDLNELKNKLAQYPLINKVGVTNQHIDVSSYFQQLSDGTQERRVITFDVGKGYFETMEIQLKNGRYFDQDFKETERAKAIMVNEKLVDEFGWESAIGKRLQLNDSIEYTVIGEMKNFYPYGFSDKIQPSVLKLGLADRMSKIVVKTDINNLSKVNEIIKDEWAKIIPDQPYAGFYQNRRLANDKESHGIIVKIFLFIGIISVLLSLVGLYSLISLNIIRKTKEIGIRKVLGAPIPKLIQIISKEFILIVLVGSVLGSIIGAVLTKALLDSIYEYHIGFSVTGLLIPVLSILLLTVLTLAFKIHGAANQNPVDALKYE